jgi:DNA repair protein RecN (Recombination protein N)
MLKHLSINNYILIPELELDFSPGFTVVTGETGAGKSILIGALSLILGRRAETDVLLDENKKCIIEGVFGLSDYGLESFFEANSLDYDKDCILRREISRQGKSRAFVNDTPVTLPVLRALGERLVDIHSQHETLMLNESGFQLAVLDQFAGNTALLQDYVNSYGQYQSRLARLRTLSRQEEQMRAEEDFTRFQYEELNGAALQEGELESLEEEHRLLAHAEEIKGNLFEAIHHLNDADTGLTDKLHALRQLTARVAPYQASIDELHKRIESLDIELKDIAGGLERIEESILLDDGRLEAVDNRLNLINGLLQKHRQRDIASLLALRNEFGNKLAGISSLDDDIRQLRKELDEDRQGLEKLSEELTRKRREAIPRLEKGMADVLARLGMEKAVLNIRLDTLDDHTPVGCDRVDFLFSANPGSPPAAVSRIASGGELSRLMLAIKSMVNSRSLLPTIILDEIDMGVSGEIAGKVGNLLKNMSANTQLIAITHLPQIAGTAGVHYKVFKISSGGRTVSGVSRLSEEERIGEVAAMLSNEKVTASARETARELLGLKNVS